MSSVVPASFNTTVGGYLQSFLNQAQGSTTDTSLFGVIAGGGTSSTTNSIFGTLQSNGSGTSAASATATALGSGGIKTLYHSVLQAIGSDPSGRLLEHWNTNGTEPSTLTTLRNYGWIKLIGKQYDPSTKTPIGAYEFTAVGYAIYQRTGGGSIAAGSSLSASALNGTSSSATSAATAQTAAVTSILSSLGFNSSSVAALASGSSSSSSSSTGSVLNVLA